MARYEADGALGWATATTFGSLSRAFGVAAQPDGGCVAVGASNGGFAADVDGPTDTVLTAHAQDGYVIRYDAEGRLGWARGLGGEEADNAAGVDAYPDGSTVVTGYFTGTVSFESSVPEPALSSSGGTDVHLVWYSASGAPPSSAR